MYVQSNLNYPVSEYFNSNNVTSTVMIFLPGIKVQKGWTTYGISI